jgi:hypothetical protein
VEQALLVVGHVSCGDDEVPTVSGFGDDDQEVPSLVTGAEDQGRPVSSSGGQPWPGVERLLNLRWLDTMARDVGFGVLGPITSPNTLSAYYARSTRRVVVSAKLCSLGLRGLADDSADDNLDDSSYLNGTIYSAQRALSCLVRAPARSWQCGGHGFESR